MVPEPTTSTEGIAHAYGHFAPETSPTVPLTAIGLRSVGWNTVRVPNIGHFRVVLGAHKGLSGLLKGSPGLNGTVGLADYPASQQTAGDEQDYQNLQHPAARVWEDCRIIIVQDDDLAGDALRRI